MATASWMDSARTVVDHTRVIHSLAAASSMASHTSMVAKARASIISEVVFAVVFTVMVEACKCSQVWVSLKTASESAWVAVVAAIDADVRSVEGPTGTCHEVPKRAYQPIMRIL